ncbi:hypothetical protein [Streptomyces sp. NPDC007369]|uniref:hypothetical protein n=1 Tax=Streptomyces sp. NPDC007369 TaxID=3154589 RepID=UPI0033C00A49
MITPPRLQDVTVYPAGGGPAGAGASDRGIKKPAMSVSQSSPAQGRTTSSGATA